MSKCECNYTGICIYRNPCDPPESEELQKEIETMKKIIETNNAENDYLRDFNQELQSRVKKLMTPGAMFKMDELKSWTYDGEISEIKAENAELKDNLKVAGEVAEKYFDGSITAEKNTNKLRLQLKESSESNVKIINENLELQKEIKRMEDKYHKEQNLYTDALRDSNQAHEKLRQELKRIEQDKENLQVYITDLKKVLVRLAGE